MKHDIQTMKRRTISPEIASEEEISGNDAANCEDAGKGRMAANHRPEPAALRQGDVLLNVSQVAEYLGISRSMACKLIRREKIPAIRLGRLLRIRKSELDEALSSTGTRLSTPPFASSAEVSISDIEFHKW